MYNCQTWEKLMETLNLLVEKVENEVIYTIEWNSTDDICSQKVYKLDSVLIFRYGIKSLKKKKNKLTKIDNSSIIYLDK